MPFDLHLTIRGLCLLARDEKANRVHVLMPTTGTMVIDCDGESAHMCEHIPWLVYDPKYAGEPNDCTQTGPKQKVKLAHNDLSIGGPTGHAQTTFPAQVCLADLGKAADAKVLTEYAQSPLPPSVASKVVNRFTLNAGGPETTYPYSSAKWDFDGQLGVELWTGVVWTIPNFTGTLPPLNTESGSLQFAPCGGKLELEIGCYPKGENPLDKNPTIKEPNKGSPAPHFAAYYALCSSNRVECPKYSSYKGGGGSGGGEEKTGIQPFTCLGGTAPVG